MEKLPKKITFVKRAAVLYDLNTSTAHVAAEAEMPTVQHRLLESDACVKAVSDKIARFI